MTSSKKSIKKISQGKSSASPKQYDLNAYFQKLNNMKLQAQIHENNQRTGEFYKQIEEEKNQIDNNDMLNEKIEQDSNAYSLDSFLSNYKNENKNIMLNEQKNELDDLEYQQNQLFNQSMSKKAEPVQDSNRIHNIFLNLESPIANSNHANLFRAQQQALPKFQCFQYPFPPTPKNPFFTTPKNQVAWMYNEQYIQENKGENDYQIGKTPISGQEQNNQKNISADKFEDILQDLKSNIQIQANKYQNQTKISNEQSEELHVNEHSFSENNIDIDMNLVNHQNPVKSQLNSNSNLNLAGKISPNNNAYNFILRLNNNESIKNYFNPAANAQLNQAINYLFSPTNNISPINNNNEIYKKSK